MKFGKRFRIMRKRILGAMIVDSVPILNQLRRNNNWTYGLAELHRFPAESWGAQLADFLQTRNFGLLPKYETHDALHLLLGYDTTVEGEIRLQAFMLGNRSASFAGRILFVLGLIFLPELWRQFRQDFIRGCESQSVREWNIPDLLLTDLSIVKRNLANGGKAR